jgi:hypothetical protein
MQSRILILDDDIFPFLPIVMMLKKEYEVTIVHTLRLAVAEIKRASDARSNFDLHVIDLHIPADEEGLDELEPYLRWLKIAPTNRGQAFARYLRDRIDKNVKFIYFTAIPSALDPNVAHLFEKGDELFVIAKTLPVTEIIERIRARLRVCEPDGSCGGKV